MEPNDTPHAPNRFTTLPPDSPAHILDNSSSAPSPHAPNSEIRPVTLPGQLLSRHCPSRCSDMAREPTHGATSASPYSKNPRDSTIESLSTNIKNIAIRASAGWGCVADKRYRLNPGRPHCPSALAGPLDRPRTITRLGAGAIPPNDSNSFLQRCNGGQS